MKSMWKGSIAFGLVTIPVKLYKATEERNISSHQLHDRCQARIHLRRICSACGEQVSLEQIVKGYEYETGKHVVLTDAELDRGAPQPHAIAITRFVSVEEIDPIQYAAAYYLGPEQVGVKAYRLLAEAMRNRGRAGVATITMRERERPVLLRLYGDVIAPETLFWPDEVRTPTLDHLHDQVELSAQELEMACSLVENLAGSFDPRELRDRYRQRLETLIAAKIEGVEPVVEPVQTPKVIDLMQALTVSLHATESGERRRANA